MDPLNVEEFIDENFWICGNSVRFWIFFNEKNVLKSYLMKYDIIFYDIDFDGLKSN